VALTTAEAVLVQTIDNLVALSERLGDVEHPGVKGLLREALIEQFLTPLLPTPFQISSGVIVDSKGHQSGQCDIIVADTSIFRPLYHARGAGLFAIESVVAVIEVKSRITRESIRQVFQTAADLKQMACLLNPKNVKDPKFPYGVFELPANILFGFRGQAQEDEGERIESVAKELAVEVGEYVQGVLVPGKTSTLFSPNGKETFPATTTRHEVRMPFAGLLNSIKRLSAERGHPAFGNYMVQE